MASRSASVRLVAGFIRSMGWVALLGVLAASACDRAPAGAAPATGTGAAPGQSGPYAIVCTVGMIADVAAGVAGDRAKVEALMGAGVDPHLYKATRSDLAKLNDADVVFYNGLLLEGKMTDTLLRLAASGKRVHAVTDVLAKEDLLSGSAADAPAGEGHPDPHVWMDPSLWAKTIAAIEEALSAFDPAGAQGYRERAARVRGEIEALDAYAARVLSSVPEESRVLVTAHDAFNYFGRRYGYRVEGIQGISTESEAGVRDVEGLVELLVGRKVRAVFVETSVSERNIRALIAGAKARGHEVMVGGSLFSDAMGAAGAYEGTYIGMIDHNVTTIARSLGGEVPEGGMSGKLKAQSSELK